MNINTIAKLACYFISGIRDYLTPLTYKLIYIFIIAISILSFILFYGKTLHDNTTELNDLWHNYSETEVQKSKALAEILRNFGYVGAIHYFKNYVLRKEERYFIWANESLEKTISAIDEYLALESGPEAKTQVYLFATTVNSYKEKLLLTKRLIAQNFDTKKIDDLVVVDDTEAREAIRHLVNAGNSSRSRAEVMAREKEVQLKNRILYGFIIIIICIVLGVAYLVVATYQIAKEYKESTLLFQSAPNAIIVADSTGLIMKANQKSLELFGYEENELIGVQIDKLLPEKKRKKKRADDTNPPVGEFNKVIPALKKNKTTFPASVTIAHYVLGFRHRTIAIVNDLTKQRKLESEATTDHLTSLANRKQGEIALERSIEEATFKKKPLSLILCDIDHFKKINDNFGHVAGDEILIAVAREISGLVRKSDLVMRWGGEEFLIVCPGLTGKDSHKRGEKIRRMIEKRFKNTGPKVTISIGITEFIAGTDTKKTFFERSDEALYQAKHNGRNQSCLI